MSLQERTGTDRGGDWVAAAVLSAGFVALLWVVELVDALLGGRLDEYGVRPRSEEGLLGIVFAPLLHAGWGHLESNTVPTLLLGFLVLLGGLARGFAATLVIWVVGGLGTWLVGPPGTVHVGASVLIFGWLVYLVVRGFVTRSLWEIIVGLTLLIVYGGLLWGVLPGTPGISWQGHLFGAVGGLLAAFLVSRPGRRRRTSRLTGPTPYS